MKDNKKLNINRINKVNNMNKNKLNLNKNSRNKKINNKINENESMDVQSIKSNDSLKKRVKDNVETENIINTRTKLEKGKKFDEISEKDSKNLDNYELYNLGYLEAVRLDKRNFSSIYISLLKREQLIMLTFVSCDDYNLFYVKINKFLFLLTTSLVMNSLLFADKTIHILFLEEGKYNFEQALPQIIYSLLIAHVIEILLCFLTMTDKYIYEIKAMKKTKEASEKIFQIIKFIRIKLIIFLFKLVLYSFFIGIVYQHFVLFIKKLKVF